MGRRKRREALIPQYLKVPTNGWEALSANRILGPILRGLFLGARGAHETTVKILSGEYKQFGTLTDIEIDREGLPKLGADGTPFSRQEKIILLRLILSLYRGVATSY